MSLTKQAKVLSKKQMDVILEELGKNRYPLRDKVMFLLSAKAGLRAKEIACLTWSMLCDAEGQLTGVIALPNTASKGKSSGREIPLNAQLLKALDALKADAGTALPQHPVIVSERGSRLSAQAVVNWFYRLYNTLGYDGCSSHSGRRTFITQAAKLVVTAGGSLRDVQQLAGHSSLSTTQRYIDSSAEAKRKLVNML